MDQARSSAWPNLALALKARRELMRASGTDLGYSRLEGWPPAATPGGAAPAARGVCDRHQSILKLLDSFKISLHIYFKK
eukprot:SAG31_NODE_4294_length_3375_cov_2.010989_1_plen_79_part_00